MSDGRSVGLSVGLSVSRSAGLSVGRSFAGSVGRSDRQSWLALLLPSKVFCISAHHLVKHNITEIHRGDWDGIVWEGDVVRRWRELESKDGPLDWKAPGDLVDLGAFVFTVSFSCIQFGCCFGSIFKLSRYSICIYT